MNVIWLGFVIPLLAILSFGTTSSSYAESDWKVYITNATVNELVPEVGKWSHGVHEVFKIPYKITNGTLQTIKPNIQTHSVIIDIKSTTDHGILEIAMPTDLVNTDPNSSNRQFYVLINGEELHYQESPSPPCFRTLSIEFGQNSQEIEIIGEAVMETTQPMNAYMSPVYVTMNKSNVDSKVITLSGCTDLKLDGSRVLFNIKNMQTLNHKYISVIPDMKGSFSTSISVEDIGDNGTYVVDTNYAGHDTSEIITVVPEFPISVVVFLISTSLLVLISSRSRLKF
jgi:predicted secreted protein with PEFG-CTERM motif